MRTCPWCGAPLPPRLGFIKLDAPVGVPFRRPLHQAPLACPSCGQGLRWGWRGQLWLLMILPFAIASVVSFMDGPDAVPTLLLVALLALGMVGVGLARRFMRFEKRET